MLYCSSFFHYYYNLSLHLSINYLYPRADVTIVVSALTTGYSTAVHGIITVIDNKYHHPKKQTLHYKALDSGVLCNLVGNSLYG